MTIGEFDGLMNVIYARWSAKAYPEVVKKRIWYYCEMLPVTSFEKIIYVLIDSAKSAPTPRDFQTQAHLERDRLGLWESNDPTNPPVKPSAEAKCWDCADAGWLYTSHKFSNYTFSFRCHCPAGAVRPAGQGPIWTNAWATTHQIEPIYPNAKGDWKPNDKRKLQSMVDALIGLNQDDRKKRKGDLKPIGNPLSRQPPSGEGA